MIDLKTMSVLIVDDVKSMRSIVRKMLKSLGIGSTMHMAENGIEGLRILNSTRIDLAIVDWKMPVMNGLQLLEAIRKDVFLRDTPVLMVTADSERELVLEAAEIEVEGYLIKPLTPAVLDEKIKTVIHQINHPDIATVHLRKARDCEENNDFNQAIEHMKHAALHRPGASRILRNLGLLYQKKGDEVTMEKCLEKAAAANPQDAVTRYLLGEFNFKKNDFLSASQYFLEVILLTKKFSSRIVDFGETLLEKKLDYQAQNLFSKIISKAGKDLAIKERIIDLCITHKQYDYAKTLLTAFLKEYPSNYGLIYNAGVVCEMTGATEEALEYFLAIERQHGSNAEIKLKIAKLYYEKDKVIQADNYLNMVLYKEPGNKEALALKRLL